MISVAEAGQIGCVYGGRLVRCLGERGGRVEGYSFDMDRDVMDFDIGPFGLCLLDEDRQLWCAGDGGALPGRFAWPATCGRLAVTFV